MNKIKKVLFTATVSSHILQFHIPYLKYFKEKGYEVHVATNDSEDIPYCDVKHNISIERNPLKLNNIKAIKELKKIIDKEKFEIIHTHTPMGSVVTRLAAIKARKKYATKVIYTAHGFHFYKGAPIINWIIYYPIEKICAKWTDCLITITNEDYEFAKKKLKCKEIEHINGIGMNTERLKSILSQEEKEKIREKLGIKKEDIVCSYVAELNKNKNQMLLIHVIEKFKKENKNVKLILIGDGVLKDEYQNYINNNELNNYIFLLGRINNINDYLSITDIYVASSKREGLPVNVMEAMYKGLPIVATNNRGHRELIHNEKNGYICRKNDVQTFYEKIKQLLHNKDDMKKIEANNRSDVQKYELEVIKEKMKKIYKKMEYENSAE